jgi:glycosyltransferase involved in cell wall biosynthesis
VKRFSVVLPVRNGGEHARLCVASVLAQTLAEDFELLVLENGSTDGTAEWLAGLRDERVRVFPAERPLSITENWTRILDVPRGPFMTIIGHDDLLEPDFLATMDKLIAHNPDAGLYFAHFRIIDGAGKFLRHALPMPARETAAEFLAVRLLQIRESFGTGYVMRSADYDRVGGIPNYDLLMHADDALWMSLMEGSWKATSPRELFSYRLHRQSTSGANDALSYLNALERFQDTLEILAERDPAIRETLARYAPQAHFQEGETLHKRLLLAALENRGEYPANGTARLQRVAERFAAPERIPYRRKTRLKALQWLHELPGGRLVYRLLLWFAQAIGQGRLLNR